MVIAAVSDDNPSLNDTIFKATLKFYNKTGYTESHIRQYCEKRTRKFRVHNAKGLMMDINANTWTLMLPNKGLQ